ncbi:MAG TPA: sensor histidine kinase [Vicinamibacterales bacterium]|nr:sensor histidine kinase [Vicinamibacterales bacterium]
MKRHPIEGGTIRAALFLGFGLTLGLWVWAGYQFTQRIADVQRDAAQTNGQYTRAQDLLSTVRAQLLLGSVYVRDALLDPNPQASDEYRRQLQETYTEAVEALEQYVPVEDSAMIRERVNRLHDEIETFRSTLLEVLATDPTRRANARLLLRNRIVPQREVVIRVSEEVQALNRAAFVEQQSRIAEVYRGTQRDVWKLLGLALAASFGIGLWAIVYSGRLEDRLREQMAKDVESTRALQRLSSQLLEAQEDERRNIARELHDEVGQVLTAIKVELAVAQRAIDNTGGPSHLLQGARTIADGALHTVRDLSHLLHPPMLDDLGLPSAVEWYLRGFTKRHGVPVQLVCDPIPGRLTAETEAACYRIVQEALTNVAKHAHATTCRVYLQRLPNTVLITVEDDGIGFDPAVASQSPDRGLGLIGIRERVSQLGGTLRVESASGKGTRLTVELPARSRTTGEDSAVLPLSQVVEPVA